MTCLGCRCQKGNRLTPSDLTDLYSWVDAVPLNRQKKTLARDFSDGVAVAKIVQFYLPKMVELQIHNYVNTHSAAKKRVNWALLNRKIFSKLNVKLEEKLVDAVIEAKPGAIELILFDLKRKVMELSPKTMSVIGNLGVQMSGRSLFRRTVSHHPTEERMAPVPFSSVVTVPTTPVPVSRQSRIPPKGITARVNSHRGLLAPQKKSSPARTHQEVKKVAENTSYKAEVEPEVYAESDSQEEPQSSDLPFQPEADATIDDTKNDGPSTSGVNGMDVNANEEHAVLPPAQLIYRGHAMIPAMMLDVKNKQVQDMESIISSLTKKVNFLDNLLIQKDSRLEKMALELIQKKEEVAEPEPTATGDM